MSPIGPVPRARARARVAASAWRSQPGQVDRAQDRGGGLRDRRRSRFAVEERRRGTSRIDAGLAGEAHARGPRPWSRHARRARRPWPRPRPTATLAARRGRVVGRRGQQHGHRGPVARPGGREVGLQVAADPPPILRFQAVRLVDDDDLPSESREPRPQEVIVQRGVVVLLRSVTQATASTRGRMASTRARCADATESMSGRSRIATGPRPLAPCSRTSWTPSHSSSGPATRRSAAGTHAIGLAGGRPPDRCRAHVSPASAFSRLDFPTPGPTDEGEHVGIARESHPPDGIRVGRAARSRSAARARRLHRRPGGAWRGIGRSASGALVERIAVIGRGRGGHPRRSRRARTRRPRPQVGRKVGECTRPPAAVDRTEHAPPRTSRSSVLRGAFARPR